MTEKILYLCHRIPYPPNKGDKIRSFNEIKFLSKDHTIDLISLADDPNDLKYVQDLKKYCRKVKVFLLNKKVAKIKGILSLLYGKSISQGYFYQKNFQKRVDKWSDFEQYDAFICFSSPMAEYIFKLKKNRKDVAGTLIMDFCDLDSDKWIQYARKTPFPLNIVYKKEAFRLFEFEKKINKIFNKSVFVSKKEAALFIKRYPDAKDIQIISNGVDYQYFDAEKIEVTQSFPSPMIVFSGAMDYYANIDGVTWFTKEILTEIKKEIPNIKFYIVGSNPDPSVKALEKDPSVVVTGFVEDIREYYKAADLCIIPLRIARGVQNKVLEAMAMGKAIISTSQAVQGINPEVSRVIEIEDDPKRIAQKIIVFVNDRDKIGEMGKAGIQFVSRYHNWQVNLERLYEL
ncbi:TIGR03087 family PEP-CTERM/XrtA system glycosyltransferase [Desulfospira joergensenii]|uniref:TIGR03087 family PEP-CTERM/XrtA system glycosyltransferase n=1 Tax=Desulfospira joergensenii TaxID=53329 RepID=UPI0003B6B961|nr:TIGR03087 family PEP-CTERM/XrtA system glycosyltransferase [Desulfospira joergensenii]